MFMEKFWSLGVVCPCHGAIYMYISIILKHLLLWNRLANRSQTLCGASLGRGKKVYINGPGHMTKMAAQKLLKIFFSRTRRPMILKLDIKHQAMKLYKIYINHDPWMTLTFFYSKVNLGRPCIWMGKNRKMSFNGKKLARNEQMDRRFIFLKIFWAQRVVCPCLGAIYMCMTMILKHLLLWNRVANQSQTLYGAFLGRVNESLYNWSRSHDQDGHHGYK